MRRFLFVLLLLLAAGCSSSSDNEPNSDGSTSEVKNFAECVAAGYPVMESFPEQCTTPDGQVFVNSPSDTPPQENLLCRDSCGDGSCQEVVCQAEGCPCAESEDTCPQDCA